MARLQPIEGYVSHSEEMPTTRTRLAEIDRDLAGLRSRHDLAMSAFKFDAANALQRWIDVLDGERRALVTVLPVLAPAPEPPSGVVPMLARPARRLSARRRR